MEIKMNEIRFIDLFRGIGGFHLGLERANDIESTRICEEFESEERGQGRKWVIDEQGLQLRSGKQTPFRCVWSNDIDKYASEIYKKHWPETPEVTGDIRAVDEKTIPDHDLLCAGFPCQAFSVAGKRKGFTDTRGTLFFEICRIAETKRPRLLLLENVKGLLNHDGGRTFGTILESLEELGYWWEYQVLNSKHFGVPQNRERVFIIGHLTDTSSREIFPIGETSTMAKQTNQVAHTIDANYWKGTTPEHSVEKKVRQLIVHNIYGGFGEGLRKFEDYSPTIRTPKGGGHIPMVVADRTRTLAGKGRNLESPKPITNALSSVQKDNLVAMRWVRSEEGKQARKESMEEGKDYTPFGKEYRELTLAEENVSGCYTGALNRDTLVGNQYRIRKLTPLECERLQGFPDGWTEEISDSQRYKCLGNAVTVNVIEYLGGLLKTSIKGE